MTSQSEIKASAEQSLHLCRTAAPHVAKRQTMLLLKTLAEHVIAEHPSDDDEPFTLEWISETYNGQVTAVDDRLEVQLGRQISIDEDGGVWIVNEEMPAITTRGDVRRLCRALGVELTEGNTDDN